MNAQTAYATITQMSPLCQVMSLPVSTLAANEMAARASKNTPRVTPTSTAKATKREAKPEYLPCRLFWMTIGAPVGVASPARAVMTLPWLAARQAGGAARAARAARCKGGGEVAQSTGR